MRCRILGWGARRLEPPSLYIQSTYGIGESVEDSSAVQDTETMVVSDDKEARGAQAGFC